MDTREVTCPECGFVVLDSGDMRGPSFSGDIKAYVDACHLAHELPDNTAFQFACPQLHAEAVRLMRDDGRDPADPA